MRLERLMLCIAHRALMIASMEARERSVCKRILQILIQVSTNHPNATQLSLPILYQAFFSIIRIVFMKHWRFYALMAGGPNSGLRKGRAMDNRWHAKPSSKTPPW